MIGPPVRPRADLDDLEAYHSPQLDVRVRLNTNESPYPPPAEFVDTWLDALREVPLHRYPDRRARHLRQELSAHAGQPAERVFCANGSNEVLQTLLLTYGGAGRRVVVFEPTYALHSHIARLTGTEVVVGERREDFTIDISSARLLVAEARPEITFLCSPNNPTGIVEPAETVSALLDASPGLVVVDEAYGEFASRSAVPMVGDDARLVVVRTYSKVWSMAALRLGFCMAPAWVVPELEKVALPYHLGAPTQLAGVLALRYAAEMDARVRTIVAERERVARALAGVPSLTPYPSGANFLLVRVDRDAHGLWQRLVERGVLVRDLSSRSRLQGCLRVTIGTSAENDAFLAAVHEALEEIPA